MQSSILWHNPRCSTCRKTMDLLKEHDVIPETMEYLKTPPNHDELEEVLSLLNVEPRELMRKKETVYQEQNLDDASLSREQLIDAMAKNPVLIQRPVFIHQGKAMIGRPPEKVLELL